VSSSPIEATSVVGYGSFGETGAPRPALVSGESIVVGSHAEMANSAASAVATLARFKSAPPFIGADAKDRAARC
jgi:hypothetical protein